MSLVSVRTCTNRETDNMRCHVAIVLFAVVGLSSQISTPQDNHYVAAVVEYFVDPDFDTSIDVIRGNYETLIREAAEQNADLVVFPERTLTNDSISFSVPIHGLLQEFPIPALHPDRYDDLLVAMSAAARNNRIYLVINARESLDCTQPQRGEECPERRVYVFNTNIVFDRAGGVINRYRKINLHEEATNSPAVKSDLGIFTTDFGVTFGHFIGFDLMFQVPAVQTVQKHNIRNIIYPSLWFSEMPYLTAIQIQESYAATMNVNLLGSGANNVGFGSSGSGIFTGRAGALISRMEIISQSKVLVARVPKIPGNVNEIYPGPIYAHPFVQTFFGLQEDPSLTAHVTRPLVVGNHDFTLVDKDVSCRFQVRLSNRTSTLYQYRAAAFSGVRSFSGIRTGGVRACSIFFCLNSTEASCGRRMGLWIPNMTALFEKLTITGTMPTPVIVPEVGADDSLIFPVSLTESLMPLEAKDYTYSKNITENMTIHTMTLINSASELYTFGLWGRVFGTDGQEPHPPVEDPVFEEPNQPDQPDQPGGPGSGWAHSLSNSLLLTLVVVHIYNQ